jgi:hypothetical protein
MTRALRLLTLTIICLLSASPAHADDSISAPVETDTIALCPRDTLPPLRGNWVQQLMATNFRINDPRIHYPRFANFLRKVYNWGDRTFNSYDTAYVVGTGKNWKFYGKSYNWLQTYAYIFDIANDQQVRFHSKINADAGLTLNFMAVSLSYMWNVNRWLHGVSDKRSNFNFSFNCALFAAELNWYSNTGPVNVTHFGSYRNVDGSRLNVKLPGVEQDMFNVNAYYFFNHRRYSQGAAYAYSKYQLRSAGTWLLGFNYARQRIAVDFSQLPQDMREYMPQLASAYNYRFTDYAVMGGYAYNAAMPHHWLYNVTALPSVGYKHTNITGSDDLSSDHAKRHTLSTNMQLKMSFTYNHRAFFAAAIARFDGGFYFQKSYSFFSSTISASALIGVRF